MLCTRCKRREATGGYAWCEDCRAWKRAYDKKYVEERREQFNEQKRAYQSDYRLAALAVGLCTSCKTREADEDHKQCAQCRARGRVASRKREQQHHGARNAYNRAWTALSSKAKREIAREIEQDGL